MLGVCADRPIPAVLEFDAQLQILELLDHKVCLLVRGVDVVLTNYSSVAEDMSWIRDVSW